MRFSTLVSTPTMLCLFAAAHAVGASALRRALQGIVDTPALECAAALSAYRESNGETVIKVTADCLGACPTSGTSVSRTNGTGDDSQEVVWCNFTEASLYSE
jgi:hypothetical protein